MSLLMESSWTSRAASIFTNGAAPTAQPVEPNFRKRFPG